VGVGVIVHMSTDSTVPLAYAEDEVSEGSYGRESSDVFSQSSRRASNPVEVQGYDQSTRRRNGESSGDPGE
jgi:hypothetical protein